MVFQEAEVFLTRLSWYWVKFGSALSVFTLVDPAEHGSREIFNHSASCFLVNRIYIHIGIVCEMQCSR